MLHIILNPHAGKGRTVKFREALEQCLKSAGADYRFYETRGRRDAIEIAGRLSSGAGEDRIDLVAMGGDGTLNEVLNGIADPSRVRLGIVPCGSGNDFAATAGIPDTPEGVADLLLRGKARFTDYLECGGIRGINAIGTGIDVDILRRYNRMKLLRGSVAYLASLILTLFTFRPKRFMELADGGELPHRAMIACVGNGRRIGGGICVCPEAVIDDGLMDIVILDDIPRLHYPGSLIKLMQKRILELPTTRFRRDSRLRIRSDAPMPIQIDGKIYEDLPFDVRVVTGQLQVYRP